ncbi:MAG: YcgN family cysteine cluster protein [Kiloniellales bacterium]
MDERPFWKRKALGEMSRGEWESLCDGCAKCCLVKLEDEDSGEIAFTDVACRLLDLESCRCRDYPNRRRRVPDCVVLNAAKVGELRWLPSTCAYRLLSEGKDLPAWHPLVTGDPASVAGAGVSVAGRVVSEESVADADLPDHIVDWPE